MKIVEYTDVEKAKFGVGRFDLFDSVVFFVVLFSSNKDQT
jgi:hypothetical protein